MIERFDGRLYIAKSLPYFLEFASPDVTKAAGLDSSRSNSASRANGPSHSATVRTTSSSSTGPGYGVAVANAHERVKEVAEFVCPSVDEEGVAQVLEAYLAR